MSASITFIIGLNNHEISPIKSMSNVRTRMSGHCLMMQPWCNLIRWTSIALHTANLLRRKKQFRRIRHNGQASAKEDQPKWRFSSLKHGKRCWLIRRNKIYFLTRQSRPTNQSSHKTSLKISLDRTMDCSSSCKIMRWLQTVFDNSSPLKQCYRSLKGAL